MGPVSALIGAHAVAAECPFGNIPIPAYAGTFGTPWGPVHCYTASDSTCSTDGQRLNSRKANIPLIWNPHVDLLMQGVQVTMDKWLTSNFPDWSRILLQAKLRWHPCAGDCLFVMRGAASTCLLILNCGMQSVTAICVNSHISLPSTLSDIQILRGIISQGEEVNRVGIGRCF